MKYYEFNDYEYYALICANNELEAVKYYNSYICEIEGEEKESSPEIISENTVMKKLRTCCNKEQLKETLEYFESCKQEFKPCLLLVDNGIYGV